MKFSELTRLEKIGVRSVTGTSDADFSDVCYDSRRVTPGVLFVAIRGGNADGHEYIKTAIALGASVIVLEDESAFSVEAAEQAKILRVVVEDSRIALAHLSEQFFGNPSHAMRLIGVTGTNGKTTVTHVIKQILEQRGETVGLIGTIGISVGSQMLPATHTTPESRELSEIMRRMVDLGTTTCVMEVSSHALALARVAALEFDIAVFTNLTQDHLDFHVTMEDYLAAKRLLFTSLGYTSVAITNADDAFGEHVLGQSNATIHSYGIREPDATSDHADLMASDIELSPSGTRFRVRKRYSDEECIIETSLIGRFNVENILAAMGALYFGVEGYGLEALSEAFKAVKPVRGRFEAIQLPSGATAVIDYAHTPDALERVLMTLGELRGGSAGLITTVFGCGGDRDRTKRPIMGRIAAALSDRVVITNDNPRSEPPEQIANEIELGVDPSQRPKCQILLDRQQAIQAALSTSHRGDTILIAGKGHEDYQVIGSKRHHFDDREIVEAWARTQV
jgi:UDP-N-acetylmuramoyl-L-alanyl-D-glutamate--2,6-diaminopimelate ligase